MNVKKIKRERGDKKMGIMDTLKEKRNKQMKTSKQKMEEAKRIGKGEIGYYGLEDWWLNKFTEEERNIIRNTYQPMGLGSDSLVQNEIVSSSQSKLAFLSGLSSCFKKPEYHPIANKILEKAETFVDKTDDVLDLHFFYQNKIQIYYRNRDIDSNALDLAIQACKQQISISKEAAKAFKKELKGNLPEHIGYKQLAIIRDKQKDYGSVIQISKQAKSEGWNGDWDKRIEKAIQKLEKSKKDK